MNQIRLVTQIEAPIQRCFDLARSIDVHLDSMAHTRERAIAGVMSGLIGLGERVTWAANHFGINFRLTSEITALDAPNFFQDEQVCGPFDGFQHQHQFLRVGTTTYMEDIFEFTLPCGMTGDLLASRIITKYLIRLLTKRNQVIKKLAESTHWRSYITPRP